MALVSPALRRIVECQPIGDHRSALRQPGEREQQIVQGDAQSLVPHGVREELVAQPQHRGRPPFAIESPGEPGEDVVRGAPCPRQRVREALLHQVPARRGQQIVAPEEHRPQRRQQPAPVPLEPGEQPVHAEPAHLRAEMHRGHVLEVVRLVEHQPAVRRQHRRLLPVVRRHAHREIGREQVVVHDDDVRLRGAAPRLEQEAALEVRALEPGAEIGLRRHGVPDIGARLLRQIGERAVAGTRGPPAERVELDAPLVLEQRVLLLPRLLEPRETDVVPPALEQRERR